MMHLPSISELSIKAKLAIGRFPLTALWTILGSFYCIYLLEDNSSDFPDHQFNIVMTLILGVSWLIGTQFFIEQQKKPRQWIFLKLLLLAALIGFVFYLPEGHYYDSNPEYLMRFYLFLIAGHLFLFIAPFIRKWEKNAYWNYLKTIASAIVRSSFFSLILYLGLVLALVAIDALFDINIRSKRYGQIFIFCLGIVNTLVYLSDFPKNIHQQTQIHFQKTLEVLVKFILIPLLILYLAILYAYSLKIILAWELPKGWVSYLIIALALLGFIIQVIIHPVQKEINSWAINKFYPNFYLLLLPLLVLLFVAIFRRISDYGITENRYFVVAIALWILGISLYLLLSKKKSLKVLPISLLCMALLSSFGFWGAVGVSKNSQSNQFKLLYTKALDQEKVLSQEDYYRLQDILDYFEDRKAVSQLDEITGLRLENFRDSLVSDDRDVGWLKTSKIWDTLAIAIDSTTIEKSVRENYYSYNPNADKIITTDIKDYDNFRTIRIYNYVALESITDEFYIKYDRKKLLINFYKTDTDSILTVLNLESELKKFSTLGENLNNVPPEKLLITSENDALNYKIVLTDLSFSKNNDSISLSYLSGFLFSKKTQNVTQNKP